MAVPIHTPIRTPIEPTTNKTSAEGVNRPCMAFLRARAEGYPHGR